MKDEKYFDLGPILEGKDLIMTIKRLSRDERIKLAADRLFVLGTFIRNVAISLTNAHHQIVAVKLLRDAINDLRDARRILDYLLKEVQQ